ncbi:MAG: hypothetical protein HQL60_03170 [Magnetococcales bacterium]|nr:hypothetical protein [Magnetococcales bacterium]
MKESALLMNSRVAWLIGLLVMVGVLGSWVDVRAADNAIKDPMQLLESLERRRVELDGRNKVLDRREQELKQLEERLNKRVEALQSLRELIQKDMSDEKNIDDSNIKRLAKIFSSMKPQEAAQRLMALDHKMAVRVLKTMREKSAAKVLGKMESQQATSLSEDVGLSLAERRRRQESEGKM